MNANNRLITQSNSRLGKVDIIKFLSNEEAWSSLPSDRQQALYALLPKSIPDTNSDTPEALPLDHTVHPFKTEYAPYIKHFLHEWQSDLREGRNTTKWRNEARLASGERAAGMFDHVLAKEREERWGAKVEEEEKVDAGEAANGDGRATEEATANGVEKANEVEMANGVEKANDLKMLDGGDLADESEKTEEDEKEVSD